MLIALLSRITPGMDAVDGEIQKKRGRESSSRIYIYGAGIHNDNNNNNNNRNKKNK